MKTHLTTEEAKTVLEGINTGAMYVLDRGTQHEVEKVNAAARIMEAEDVKVRDEIDTPEFMDLLNKFAHESSCEEFDEAEYNAARKAIVAYIAALSAPAAPSEHVPPVILARTEEIRQAMGNPMGISRNALIAYIEFLLGHIAFTKSAAAAAAASAKPVEQEPVAWAKILGEGNARIWFGNEKSARNWARGSAIPFAELTPLYASPQAPVAAAQWISVDDQLPEVETDVLVRGKRGDSVCHDVAGMFHDEWMAQGSEKELRFIVTHWQPLPPAPDA